MRIHRIVLSLVAAAVVGCGDDLLAPIPDGPMTQSNFRLHATYGWVTSIWGDASGELLALNESALLRYDGEDWHRTGLRSGSPVDIWGSSTSNLFAVGGNGTINHYDGINWTTMPSPTGYALSAVWGSSAEDVYAVGEYSTLLHYDGVRWSRVSVPVYQFPQHFRDVWGSSGSDVFALGHSVLLHYNGSEWRPFHDIGGSVLWGSGDHLFVGQQWPREGVVAHYDGIGWSDLDTGTGQRFLAAWGSSANDVYFVGTESVMHWDGSTWTESLKVPLYDGYLPALRCIWGRGAGDVFIGGGQFLHYDGARWSPVLNLISPVQEVCVISEAGFITFGRWYGDEMFLYDGAEWKSLGEFNGNVAAAAGSPSEVFIVGTHDNDGDDDGDGYADGYVSRFVPGVGNVQAWFPRGLEAVWVDSGNYGFAVGAGGIVLRYDGFAWQEMPSPTTSNLSAVWGSSGHDIFAAGRDGYALEILHFDGLSWRVMLRQESSDFFSRIRIWGSSNRDVYLGSRDFFLHYDGTSWKPVDLGGSFPVWDLWGRSESDVYVSGANGISHYDGNAWKPLDLEESRGLGQRIWGTDGALFTTGVEGVFRLDLE